MTTETQEWERNVLEKVALAAYREQRRSRRWGIFFKALFLLYLIIVLLVALSSSIGPEAAHLKPHTAVIDLRGPIKAGSMASAQNFNYALRQAFKDKHTRGIIIRINSPGGSPVQSDYMYNEIVRLRHEHPEIKVYAVCTDACASGAYFVASAADYIYANQASLIGSIGVLMNGFGFVDAIKKLGVTRRLFTAGNNKASLDAFLPVRPDTRAHINKMLEQIHQFFISRVELGRGKRLKANNKEIFSGRAWTGEDAIKLGLIDGFASPQEVADNYIKQKNVVNYTLRRSPFERLAKRFGAQTGEAFATSVSNFLSHIGLESSLQVK